MASPASPSSSGNGNTVALLVRHVYRNVSLELPALAPTTTTVADVKRRVQSALRLAVGEAEAAAASPGRQRLIYLGKVCTDENATLQQVLGLSEADAEWPAFTLHLVLGPPPSSASTASASSPTPAPAPASLGRSSSADMAASAAVAAATALRAASPTPTPTTSSGGNGIGASAVPSAASAESNGGPSTATAPSPPPGPPTAPTAPAAPAATAPSPLPLLLPTSAGAPRMAVSPEEQEDDTSRAGAGDGGFPSAEGLRRRRLQRFGAAATAGPSSSSSLQQQQQQPASSRSSPVAIPSAEAGHRASPPPGVLDGPREGAVMEECGGVGMVVDPVSWAAAWAGGVQGGPMTQAQAQQAMATMYYQQQQWCWWQMQQQQAAAAAAWQAQQQVLQQVQHPSMAAPANPYAPAAAAPAQQPTATPPTAPHAAVNANDGNGNGGGIRPPAYAAAVARARAVWALLDWQLAVKFGMMVLLMHPGDPQRLAALCGVSALAYLYQTGILALLLGPAFRRPRFGMAGEEEEGEEGEGGQGREDAVGAGTGQRDGGGGGEAAGGGWKRRLRALVWEGAIPAPEPEEGWAAKAVVDGVVLAASVVLSLVPTCVLCVCWMDGGCVNGVCICLSWGLRDVAMRMCVYEYVCVRAERLTALSPAFGCTFRWHPHAAPQPEQQQPQQPQEARGEPRAAAAAEGVMRG